MFGDDVFGSHAATTAFKSIVAYYLRAVICMGEDDAGNHDQSEECLTHSDGTAVLRLKLQSIVV